MNAMQRPRPDNFLQGYRPLNVGLPQSVSLIKELGERYPRAEPGRVLGVNRSSVYEACTRRRRVDCRRIALRQLALSFICKAVVLWGREH